MGDRTYFHEIPMDILDLVNRRVYNPTIVLMGGYDDNGNIIKKLYKYDTVEKVWSDEYSFYAYCYGSFCVESETRTMFMSGGTDYKNKSAIFCSYHLRNGFRRHTPLLKKTTDNSLCIIDGDCYNWDYHGITSYEQVKRSWTPYTKEMCGRSHHTSVVVNTDIITFGGLTTNVNHSTPFIYDTVRGTIRELLEEPYKRTCHCSVYSKEKGCVFLYGGYDDSGNVLANFSMYDIRSEKTSELKGDRLSKDAKLVTIGEHSIALFGGVKSKTEYQSACSDTCVYDMRANRWEHRPEMDVPVKCYAIAVGLL